MLALVAAAVIVGVFVWVWVSGGSGEASVPITAPQLTVAPLTEATAAPTQPSPTTPAPSPQATSASTAAPQAATASPAATPAPTTAAPADAPTQRIFRIVPDESEVRFIIDEILRGEPTTVVGTTNQVAGDIRVNFENPAASEIGLIRINVRTLRTAEERRDRATRSRILQSAQPEYEFAEFAPTAIEGLPDTVAVGQPVEVRITGDFTIRNITNPVTFEATVTLVSEERLEGTAATTIERADYDLVIPSVPFVANVSETVGLEIDFAANSVEAP